jgi:DNA-binding transcriptional LysR family regulator
MTQTYWPDLDIRAGHANIECAAAARWLRREEILRPIFVRAHSTLTYRTAVRAGLIICVVLVPVGDVELSWCGEMPVHVLEITGRQGIGQADAGVVFLDARLIISPYVSQRYAYIHAPPRRG